MLDLESSARRCCSSWGQGTDGGGGKSARVSRAFSQTPWSPALSPGATFLKPLPSPDPFPQTPNPPAQTPRTQPRHWQEPALSHRSPDSNPSTHDPLPQVPGGSSPQPWEPIYPNVDAGETLSPLPDYTVLLPGPPVTSPDPYDLCVDAAGSQAQISQVLRPYSKDPTQNLANLSSDPTESLS